MEDVPWGVFIFLLQFALLPISFSQLLLSIIIANVLFRGDRRVIFLAIIFRFLFCVPAPSFFSFVEPIVPIYPPLQISTTCFAWIQPTFFIIILVVFFFFLLHLFLLASFRIFAFIFSTFILSIFDASELHIPLDIIHDEDYLVIQHLFAFFTLMLLIFQISYSLLLLFIVLFAW